MKYGLHAHQILFPGGRTCNKEKGEYSIVAQLILESVDNEHLFSSTHMLSTCLLGTTFSKFWKLRIRNDIGGMLWLGCALINWTKPAGNESIMSPLIRTWHLLGFKSKI